MTPSTAGGGYLDHLLPKVSTCAKAEDDDELIYNARLLLSLVNCLSSLEVIDPLPIMCYKEGRHSLLWLAPHLFLLVAFFCVSKLYSLLIIISFLIFNSEIFRMFSGSVSAFDHTHTRRASYPGVQLPTNHKPSMSRSALCCSSISERLRVGFGQAAAAERGVETNTHLPAWHGTVWKQQQQRTGRRLHLPYRATTSCSVDNKAFP